MEQCVSKVDLVYSSLMDDIMSGMYMYGDRLVISHIAARYNVSNIPVREALRRMSSEGYVQMNTNQGAIISGYNKQTITEIMQIKAVLEGYATRLSIDHITAEDLNKLRELNEQFGEIYAQDARRASTVNVCFHMAIYSHCGNNQLYNAIQTQWTKWQIAKALLPVQLTSTKDSMQDHEKILQLIESKSYEEAERFVREHKFKTGAELVDFLR